MKIAILGGGNIGTLMAGEFAAAGHEVRLKVSDPSAYCGSIDVLNDSGKPLCRGVLSTVTASLSDAVCHADMIWVTYPTFMLEGISVELLSLVSPGQMICVVPGNSAEFYFREHVKRGAVLVGMQRVHAIARLDTRGRSVCMLGRKPEVQIATLPAVDVSQAAGAMAKLFGVPVVALPTYLVETLTPSNPVLHTARIRSMFEGWVPGMTYPRNYLFYEEWDDASSRLMLDCDDELQDLCRVLEGDLGVDLSGVKSLRNHYESPDAEAMTRKISNISAFKGLSSPMRETKSGLWEPDLQSRYFRADFAYGLKAIVDLAVLAGVDTPELMATYEWWRQLDPEASCFSSIPKSLNELAELYQ